MASTFSPNLRLELIGTGEQQGTWGTTTNTNLGTLLEEAIGGYVSVTVSDVADTTLTTNNGSADQSRNMVINLTGALTGTRNVICPAIEKLYIVKNATTGSQSVVFKVSGQTGITIPNGSTYLLYVDGTDARQVTGSIAGQNANNVAITGGSITGITDLAIADGGTGASNAASARTNLGLGTISTQDSNNVSITGGSITGITDLAVADGGTGASDAGTARTNLGLGTISTQNSNNVSITGGSVTGITDLALADGGTGASLSDPNANAVMGWNDTAGTMRFFTAGAGIEINSTSNTILSTVTAGGNYAMQVFTNTTPSGTTWTKPAGLVAVKVTVVGGGGGSIAAASPSSLSLTSAGASAGGAAIKYIPAPSIPGPVTVTVGAGGGPTSPYTGGTSSFGTFASATGGSLGGGSTSNYGDGTAGGTGSNGTYNIQGGSGENSYIMNVAPAIIYSVGNGGASILSGSATITAAQGRNPEAGLNYGGGATGAIKTAGGANTSSAVGGQGIVIVEEFY